ncbi:PRC-barrel domain-containing protein [Lewinella sp. 4G2]|uniref:PRC-barrel domain-containing protein n=1 Tax=Lewinella sp. 4G2 TaxID=1803372 RepID=UPI0007B4AD32|nr:PRC-barrel domain-containing protein [Lewinella sp. 4G2]OAV42793.1 hypothetical protein A3850_016285 [Lewinella sp. 4G2]
MSTIVKTTSTVTPTEKYTTKNVNLKFVDNLSDYQVHHDDTDIRGFDVRLSTGEKIGEVEGLLADVPARQVRYVEIEVEDDIINRHTLGTYTNEDRNVLIPIGLVKINADKTVTILGLGLDHFVDYPRFNRTNGYTTSFEIDTTNYLSDFHEFGSSYNRSMFDSPDYRRRDRHDNNFYMSKFFVGQ